VRVLAGDQESTWSLAELLDQRRPGVDLAATGDSENDHVMLLHLPHSALAAPESSPVHQEGNRQR
jgi:hypothetical protein